MELKYRNKAFYITAFLGCLTLTGSVFAAKPVNQPVDDPRVNSPQPNNTQTNSSYKGDVGYKGEITLPVKPHHFEGIGALGIAKLKASNSLLQVTSTETDTLVQTNANVWDTFAGQLGAGYIYYFCDPQVNPDKVKWFPALEPELNLYYLASDSIKGDVYRYGSANFNDFTFDIPVHSTRLMFDLALTMVSYKKLSAFAIGGIGEAWTKLGYSDSANSGNSCASTHNIGLSNRTNTNFVWEAGGGLLYSVTDNIGVSVEYLYTHLGKVRVNSSGNGGPYLTPSFGPTSFKLNAQSALLGLHIGL